MAIPKPKYCGQDWLEMTPTKGGRICGACSKVIKDFTKMPWSDIERIQKESNNSVCGMYSNRQLDNWGREHSKMDYFKRVGVGTLMVALTATVSYSQDTHSTDSIQRTIIRGTITSKSIGGKIDTLIGITIRLKGTNIETLSDVEGSYQLDISKGIEAIRKPVLEFTLEGYESLELKLDKELRGEHIYDAQLAEDRGSVTNFYVRRPSLISRVKYKFKKLFGRRK